MRRHWEQIDGLALKNLKWMFDEKNDEHNLLDEVNYVVNSFYGLGHF
tara:strand:- start:18995 stop:19135 length:141 start_codon:yes stop_codon:yes gene_type:complete